MEARAAVFTIIGFLLVAPVAAQQQTETAADSPGQRVQLFDQVPNYAEILVHQWSSGVPGDVTSAEQSTEHYGRLLDAPPHPLSVAEAIELALQNNTQLKIQRLGPSAAAAQVRRAQGAFDAAVVGNVSRDRATTPAGTLSPFVTTAPVLFQQNLKFNAGLQKMLQTGGQLSLLWQNDRFLTNPSVVNELLPQYTTSLTLSLNQPLLRNFGWRYSLLFVEVAQNTEQATYQQYEAAIATLISQVERTYWALVLAIEAIDVQEQGLVLANEVLRQNQGKFKVGALPQTAVLEAQSEVARREANLIRTRNLRDNARDNLRAVINYPAPNGGPLLMIEPQDKPTVVPFDIDLNRSLQRALEQRPELIAARLVVHNYGLQRKIAENQLLPQLNFVGGIGVNGLSGNAQAPVTLPNLSPTPGAPTVIAAANPSLVGDYGRALELLPDGRYYNYTAGAVIQIPIDNSTAKADYSAANIGFQQSRLSLQQLEESVTLEVKTAVSNLQTDLKSIDATRIARELAEENVRNQKARYDVGLATTKDLLDFQDRLTQAQALEVEALTRYNADLAEMHRVDGTLLAARNVVVERAPASGVPWWEKF